MDVTRCLGPGYPRATKSLAPPPRSPTTHPIPEEEPPSSALASMVQHLPLELMDSVVRNLSNDDSVTDSQMLMAISRWAEVQWGWPCLVPRSPAP